MQRWKEKYNQKCDEIEENLRLYGTKKMNEILKELVGDKKGGTGGSCVNDKNVQMIFEKGKVLERWDECIGDLFADNRPKYIHKAMTGDPQW